MNRAQSSSKPQHIVMIMLDGFRPDYLTLYDLPTLTRLARDGVWVAESRSVFPSTTTTNQTSFVTGALPARTGIPNNARYDRDRDGIISPLRDNAVPTLAERFRAAGLGAVAVNHFMLEQRGADPYLTGDIDVAIAAFKQYRPALLVYYNSQTDAVGHSHGPFSPQMAATAQAADREIARLLAALEDEGALTQTAVVVASDHGMSPADDQGIRPSLPEALEGAGLRFARRNEEIAGDTDLIWLQFGCALLCWRNGRRTPEREAALQAALAKIEGADVLDAAALGALGADPERLADCVVVPRSGYGILPGSGRGGLHGRPQEAHNTLLFWGAGVASGQIVHRASIVDIVPTLLALMQFDQPRDCDGSALLPVLAQPQAQPEVPVMALRGDGVRFKTPPPTDTAPGVYVIEADLHAPQAIKSIEVVSHPDRRPQGPRQYRIEAGLDRQALHPIAAGELPPLSGGAAHRIKLEDPVFARCFRLIALSSYGEQGVHLAECRLWADVEAAAANDSAPTARR